MVYATSYDIMDDEEQESIQNLLACSTRNDNHEKKVLIGSWDEVCSWTSACPMGMYSKPVRSWKSVCPMGVYSKPKKKNTRNNKKTLPILKDVKYTTDIPLDVFPYRYRFYEKGKAGHTSTNVTSYSTPSWRYIIDWKTYTYLDRLSPQEKESTCRQFTRRPASADFGMHIEYTCDGNKYHMWKINPADVFDDKLFAAYKESLTYVFSDYVNIKQHEHLIFQRPIVVVKSDTVNKDGNSSSDAFVDEKKKMNANKKRNKELNEENEERHQKKDLKRKSGRKKSRHKNKQNIVKRRASLPPITTIKSPSDGKASKDDEFPFSIGQMLTTKSCCEVERQKNERQIEKMEKLATSMGQSYDFYLPTLKYGNYVHLFSERDGKLLRDRDINKMPNIQKQERT